MKTVSPRKTNRFLIRAAGACLAAVILLAQGCGGPEAQQSENFKSECWSDLDTISLKFQNTDVNALRKITFPITFTTEYPFNNIFLKFALRAPSGKTSDFTYQFQLMDATGKWTGDESGSEVSFNLSLGDPVKLTETGEYRFSIYQFMRQSQLCGIKAAGIAIASVKP